MEKIFINLNKYFKKVGDLRKLCKNNLYYSTVAFNQTKIITNFLNKLMESHEVFANFDEKDLTLIHNRNNDKKDETEVIYHSFGNFLTFIIDDYKYYIQLDDNPFMSDSYIIATQLLAYNKESYFTKSTYAPDNNLNELFGEIYSEKCDIEKATQNLLDYFYKNIYRKQSLIYENGRLSLIKLEK